MAQEDDKGFFDRLGEILNAPLPGTQASNSQAPTAVDEEDDDSLMEHIKDILNAPLPGTPQAEATAGEAAAGAGGAVPGSDTPAQAGGQAGAVTDVREPTPELDEDELDEAWWQQDWAAFRAHQARQREGLELKQGRDQEKFAAYQQQEKQRFEAHQHQELEAFTRQQHWRLNAWHQAVANSPGQKPPPPPWDLPAGTGMPPPGFPMPGPMMGPPPWMRPPGRGRRR
jgi:hypothetical protein